MDTGMIIGYTVGYLATIAGVFLLYLPVIILLAALLVAGGVLQLLLLPFASLGRRLRRRPAADMDPSWLLDRHVRARSSSFEGGSHHDRS